MSELKIQYPNTFSFKFSPRIVKTKKESPNKVISGKLMCTVIKVDNVWKAKIDTTSLEDFGNITILPFSEETFNLKGKNDIFSINPDEKGRYTRINKDNVDCTTTPSTSSMWTSLRENHIFSGKIIKVNNNLFFDIKEYIGKS